MGLVRAGVGARRLLVALLSVAVLAGCGNDGVGAPGLQLRLEAVLVASARSNNPVRLADVTDFAWDRFHSFPPYTSDARITDALGFQWTGGQSYDLEERDDVSLLVFVSGDRVTASLAYPRDRGDFAGIDPRRAFTPATAVFRAHRTPGLPGVPERIQVSPADR